MLFSLLQAALSHLACALHSHELHICALLHQFAVIDENAHKSEERHENQQPVTEGVEQQRVRLAQIHVATVHRVNVGHSLAIGVCIRGLSVAFGYGELVGREFQRFVFFGVGVEIHKLAFSDAKIAHLLWNELVGEFDTAFHIVALRSRLDVVLRVERVKLLREADGGGFDVFDIAATGHRDGVVGGGESLQIGRSDGIFNGELTHSTGKARRAWRGERGDVN